MTESDGRDDGMRRNQLMRTMLQVLDEAGGPLPGRDVFARIRERLPFTAREQSRTERGQVRAENYLGFRSGGLSTLGMIAKSPDGWLLTDEGRAFIRDHPQEDLERVFGQVYRQHRKEQQAPDRRAWLVRGSSVAGVNVVPRWLEVGFVSLRAQRLPSLPVNADRAEIDAAVAEAYSTRGVAYQRRKAGEYERFLRRMAVDDLVLTTAEGDVYVGRVTGEPFWAGDDDSLPARLRRNVEWLNEAAPVAFADLPEPLPGRLGATGDLVDLTDSLAVVESLLDVPEPEDEEEPGGEVVKPSELRFPDVTQELADELFLDRAWLTRLTRLLWRRKQIILYGPPGTGKTFVAQRLARFLTDTGKVRLVQFHPSYAYEDFFQGYRPVAEGGFRLKNGPLAQLAEDAAEEPATPYVLIVDEINRANLAKVFGELYFLLEYRDQSVQLLYGDEGSEDFALPANVFLIGTMNTADRSIALVDAAMRRRFAFVSLHPDDPHVRDVLRGWLAKNRPGDGDLAVRLLDELNRRIANSEFRIGPSYLMRPWVYEEADGFEQVWETDLLPLLVEHHAGDGTDVPKRYGLPALLAALARADAAAAALDASASDDAPAEPVEP